MINQFFLKDEDSAVTMKRKHEDLQSAINEYKNHLQQLRDASEELIEEDLIIRYTLSLNDDYHLVDFMSQKYYILWYRYYNVQFSYYIIHKNEYLSVVKLLLCSEEIRDAMDDADNRFSHLKMLADDRHDRLEEIIKLYHFNREVRQL